MQHSANRSELKYPWQTDWSAVALFLEQELAAGRSVSEIGRLCAGYRIEWTGLLEELDLDDQYPFATFRMPNLSIRLRSNDSMCLWGLSVPIKLGTQSEWKLCPLDTYISFSAIVVSAPNPFGSISEYHNPDGSQLISMSVEDGRPLLLTTLR